MAISVLTRSTRGLGTKVSSERQLAVPRLLRMEWTTAIPARTASLLNIAQGGPQSENAKIRLPAMFVEEVEVNPAIFIREENSLAIISPLSFTIPRM